MPGMNAGTVHMSLRVDDTKKFLKDIEGAGHSAQEDMSQTQGEITKSFDSSFGKIAKMAAVAFGVTAAVNFGKACVKSFNRASEAQAKLAQVMRNTMSANGAQIKQIVDLTGEYQRLGVIASDAQTQGLQELGTYVTHADSLKTLLPVLSDMTAQQYGLSASGESMVGIATMMGKVLDGQVGALSRYGYKFDAAQEKILKYGNEAERVATLSEVVSQSVGGMNAALAKTPAGQMKQLSNAFGTLKESLGKSFAAIITPIVQQLNFLVIKLIDASNAFSAFISKITGINFDFPSGSAIAAGYEDAASALDDTAGAAKKAKNALGGFDELNTLSGAADNAAAGGGSGLEPFAGLAAPALDIKEPDTSWISGLQTKFGNFGAWLQKNFGGIGGDLKTFFVNVGDSLVTSFAKNKDKLSAAFDSLKAGCGSLFGSLGSSARDGLKIVTGHIAKWSTDNKDLFVRFWDNTADIFSKGTDLAGHIADDLGTVVEKNFQEHFGGVIESVSKMATDIAGWLMRLYNEYLMPIVSSMLDWMRKIWDENLKDVVDQVVGFVGRISELIMDWYENVLKPIIDWIMDNVVPIIRNVMGIIVDIVGGLFNAIMGIIKGIMKVINGIIDFLTGAFTGNWEKAWNGIRGIIDGVWDIIWNNVKGVVNLIIDGINLLLAGVHGTVAAVVNTIGGVAGAIGSMLGKDWSFSMPKEPPRIPKLATGGVVSQPTLAMIGERGQEAVMPLEHNTGWIDSLAAKINRSGGNGGGDIVINAPIYLDGVQVGDASRRISRQNRAAGRPVIQGI